MNSYNLNDFKNGWFIGDFNPSLYKNNFEVGIKKYKKGDKERKHYHKYSKEFTIIVAGAVKMNGTVYCKDSIIQINENESTNFESLEDTITVVVKTASIEGDKHYD